MRFVSFTPGFNRVTAAYLISKTVSTVFGFAGRKSCQYHLRKRVGSYFAQLSTLTHPLTQVVLTNSTCR
jgi:hypothetical protein